MSKIYGISVRKWKTDPWTIDVSSLASSPVIEVKGSQINFIFDHDLTDKEMQDCEKLRSQLDLSEKEEYAALKTDAEKLVYREKKLGLI